MWKAKKTLTNPAAQCKANDVVAKSTARFDSWNSQKVRKRLNFVRRFFCARTIPLAGCAREPSGSPVLPFEPVCQPCAARLFFV